MSKVVKVSRTVDQLRHSSMGPPIYLPCFSGPISVNSRTRPFSCKEGGGGRGEYIPAVLLVYHIY